MLRWLMCLMPPAFDARSGNGLGQGISESYPNRSLKLIAAMLVRQPIGTTHTHRRCLMSPERILEIAVRVETRIYPEFNTTTDVSRRAFLDRQLDRACVLRVCSWLKAKGLPLPSLRGHRIRW